MLDQSPAFSSFSTDDIAKAKEFYGETLGLRVEETDEGLQLNLLGGGSVFIYPKGNHEPATFTVLNFSVDNIDEVVAELQKKGVTMEQYDMPGIQTDERGIARREGEGMGPKAMAWFKDPAGNVIGVMQEEYV